MDLVDEGFAAYSVKGEGLPFKLDKLVTHLAMMCDDKPSVSAANYVTYIKGLRETIAFIFNLIWGDIVIFTQKIKKFHGG